MTTQTDRSLSAILRRGEAEVLAEWLASLPGATGSDAATEAREAREFLAALIGALASGGVSDIGRGPWASTREFLTRLSQNRAHLGFTPSETASFVFSLKKPIFTAIRHATGDAAELADLAWEATAILDQLGLFVTEHFQKAREGVIQRQQQEMMELSTPVISLWDGILALPVIGTLDSARTQVVMENLLQRIVDTRSMIAILDITGVPTVDTLVAQHLLKTVAAARLMGADCIISGVRPQIAQTIVHLGVDLNSVTTKATLADAFEVALRRTGQAVVRTSSPEPPVGPVRLFDTARS